VETQIREFSQRLDELTQSTQFHGALASSSTTGPQHQTSGMTTIPHSPQISTPDNVKIVTTIRQLAEGLRHLDEISAQFQENTNAKLIVLLKTIITKSKIDRIEQDLVEVKNLIGYLQGVDTEVKILRNMVDKLSGHVSKHFLTVPPPPQGSPSHVSLKVVHGTGLQLQHLPPTPLPPPIPPGLSSHISMHENPILHSLQKPSYEVSQLQGKPSHISVHGFPQDTHTQQAEYTNNNQTQHGQSLHRTLHTAHTGLYDNDNSWINEPWLQHIPPGSIHNQHISVRLWIGSATHPRPFTYC
jgi:hypothetical protein